MDVPRYSIVVPVYNRADRVGRTLASLAAIEHDSFEIIVVDDGSTDDTVAVVERMAPENQALGSRLRILRLPHGERCVARNAGAKAARGEYVNFFDSDDIALPEFLQAGDSALSRRPQAEWLYVRGALADDAGHILRRFPAGEAIREALKTGNAIGGVNAVMVRRDIALANPFCEEQALFSSEDWDLWLRLAAQFAPGWDNRVCHLQIDHPNRSVRTEAIPRVARHKELMITRAAEHPAVRQFIGDKWPQFVAGNWLYVALHAALAKAPPGVILKYWFRAVRAWPAIGLSRTSAATLKRLMLRWA